MFDSEWYDTGKGPRNGHNGLYKPFQARVPSSSA